MEPPPRFELGPSAIPRRRSDRWSYEGRSTGHLSCPTRFLTPSRRKVPGAGLEPASAPSKAVRPTQLDDPGPRASGRTRTGCLPLTRRLLWPGELQRREYARRDSNPHQHGPQPCPSTCLRHERMRAAPRGRTGSSAVRRRSRSRARRRGWGTRDRTWTLLFQRQACCLITPFPIEYAGRDLNPQTARFELASFAGLALPARTPPGDRTLYPSIKSRVLHRYSSRRSKEPYRGVEPR
jgi:hypothetical protein